VVVHVAASKKQNEKERDGRPQVARVDGRL
jgi:hypothetical protein